MKELLLLLTIRVLNLLILLIHHLILIKVWIWLKGLRNLTLAKFFLRKDIILWQVCRLEEHLLILRLIKLLIGLHIESWVNASEGRVCIILVEIVILTHLRQIQLLWTLIHIHLLVGELVVLKCLLLDLKVLLHGLVIGAAELL